MGLFSFFKKNKPEQQEAAEQAAEVSAFQASSLANVHSIYPEREPVPVLVREEKPVSSSGVYLETDLSDASLRTLVGQAIAVFEDHPGVTADRIVEKINVYCDDKDLSLALYRFIPVAYCRLFFPEPQYSDAYFVGTGNTPYQFSEDRLYNTIVAESRAVLADTTSGEKMIAVVSHSTEFGSINNALNGGAEINDLIMSPVVFP